MGGFRVTPTRTQRREVSRPGQQRRALCKAICQPVARRLRDAARDRGFPEAGGAVPAGPISALVPCRQGRGLVRSLPDRLDGRVARADAPFVVLHAALAGADRQALPRQGDSLRRLTAPEADLAGQAFTAESAERPGRDHLQSLGLMPGAGALPHVRLPGHDPAVQGPPAPSGGDLHRPCGPVWRPAVWEEIRRKTVSACRAGRDAQHPIRADRPVCHPGVDRRDQPARRSRHRSDSGAVTWA